MLKSICIFLFASVVSLGAIAQEPQQAQQQGLKDALLDELEGQWCMNGTLMGEPVEYNLDASWVLGHQFLLLEMREVSNPPQYEAAIFIGYDDSGDQYVVHWLDQFGAKPSATLGYGERDKNSIRLLFDYPSSQFRDTFTFDDDSGQWHFYIEAKKADGSWSEFADYTVVMNQPGK
jgi:hypothetical protein